MPCKISIQPMRYTSAFMEHFVHDEIRISRHVLEDFDTLINGEYISTIVTIILELDSIYEYKRII